MTYFCCEEGRRSLVRAHATLNGIDHLEVVHREEPDIAQQQRTLRVFFVKAAVFGLQARFPNADPSANAGLVQITGAECPGRFRSVEAAGRSRARASGNPRDAARRLLALHVASR